MAPPGLALLPDAAHAPSYTITDLDGFSSVAQGINVGGDFFIADGRVQAFISSGDFMLDPNDYIPADPAWGLSEARAINDVGQIVGTGSIGRQTHAYLLTPIAVPEPGDYAVVTGVALLGYVAWRRRPAR